MRKAGQLSGLLRDPVLASAGALGLLSMLLVPPDLDYRHYPDWKVLICLLVLTGLTFLAAMFLTNDVALITLVPLSLLVFRLLDDRSALIRVIVLQTIAANVGSSLTPVGNPQNLFLFSHYKMTPPAFLSAVWPIVLAGGLLLAFVFFFLFIGNLSRLPALQILLTAILDGRGKVILAGALLLVSLLLT